MIHQLQKKVILLTGGGSAGHVFPLLAVSEQLIALAIDNQMLLDFYYLGPQDDYSATLQKNGIKVMKLTGAKYRRYFDINNFLDIFRFFWSILQAFWKVFWLMPDVIFSKGGTGALPVVLAGWFYHIPVIIHESDSAPGLSNLLSSRFAKRVAVGFPQAARFFKQGITAHVGNPVREKILRERVDQKTGKERLGFDAREPLVVVLGGSQGSQKINEFILVNLKSILEVTQVLHQTGNENFAEVDKLSKVALEDVPTGVEAKHRYLPKAFLDSNEMTLALSGADLVIARSGASTVFELAAFGKPAILIPHSAGSNNHQTLNAQEFAQAGAGVVIEEQNLFPAIFLKQLKDILNDPEKLKVMSASAGKFFKPDAAHLIAQEILRLA